MLQLPGTALGSLPSVALSSDLVAVWYYGNIKFQMVFFMYDRKEAGKTIQMDKNSIPQMALECSLKKAQIGLDIGSTSLSSLAP
jgi:hypothetical protein